MRKLWLVLVFLVIAASAGEGDFSFVILGDRTGGHHEGIYGAVVEKSLSEEADLYVTVGDQIEGYTDDTAEAGAQWDEYFGLVEPLPVPLHLTPGNHDIWDDASEELWRERTGREPSYSFDHSGVHFVVLDTSRWDTVTDLPETNLAWLEEDLEAHADARLTFVFFHKPFFYDTLAEGGEDPLHALLVEHGVDGVFMGHYHTYCAADYDGIAYTLIGSSGADMGDDNPYLGHFYHYAVVKVEGDSFDVAIVPLTSAAPYPRDFLTIADHKLMDRIRLEAVAIPGVYLDEADLSKPFAFEVELENVHDAPLEIPFEWRTEGTGWTVEPATGTILLEPDAALQMAFNAHSAEGLYPLPRFILEYPYREDRSYPCDIPPLFLRTQEVHPIAEPVVDGVLAPDEWASAAVTESFCSGKGDPVQIEETRFYWGYDDEYLYIAADCVQEDPESLVMRAEDMDGAVYLDDCVGFFIAPADTGGDNFQIYFNPKAVSFDQRIFINDEGRLDTDPTWNADFRSATTYGDGGWSIEIAIPYTTLETAAPSPGDTWRANFRRKEMSLGSAADWQYPIDYDINLLGRLLFTE